MHELLRIPRPSHLDDWEIFDEFEEQVMRSQLGRSQFDEWLLDRARDAIDKEHFDRFMRLVSAVAMRESISRAERTGEGTNRLGMVRRIEHLVWER